MAEKTTRTADVVLLAWHNGELHVLLIQRGKDPFKGRWALPGGRVDAGELPMAAAFRELAEETGISLAHLDLVGVYDAPGRDPRGRYVTTAYVAELAALVKATAGDDARDARWIPLSVALAEPANLAFDHPAILRDATKVAGVAC